MYLNRPDYDEMKRREAIVTAQFLDEAERMVEQGMPFRRSQIAALDGKTIRSALLPPRMVSG